MKELRSVLPYFRPHRRVFAFGMALVVVANAFAVVIPELLGRSIDALRELPPAGRGEIVMYALLIVGAALISGAARYGMREILNGVSRRVEVAIRDDFVRHLFRLDAGFYNRSRTGDLMSLATNDTLAVRQAAGPAVMYSVNTLVNFALVAALMLSISVRLTALVLVPMTLLVPAAMIFGRAIHRRFERIQEQYSELSTMVQENLSGLRIVRAYRREEAQRREFDVLNRGYLARNMRLARAAGAFHPVLGLLTSIASVIILWHGGQRIIDGTLSVGDFVAFSYYLTLLAWPMIALGWVVNLIQRGNASMGRLNRVFATKPAIASPEGVRPVRSASPDAPLVEFRRVRFRFPGATRDALTDIDFSIPQGSTAAIVGPTGAGKSTLVSLIARLWDPVSGEVLFGGRPLPSWDLRELRSKIGFAPQDTFVFSMTLEENVALGTEAGLTKSQRGRAVHSASKSAQLDKAAKSLPSGYETFLGERGINLSGGQKQRVALARALARNPDLLILDDVLSAVDTRTEARILQGLKSEFRGRTAIVISHRATAVQEADIILVLDQGRIVERGRHEELLERDGVYAELLRRQLLEQDLATGGDFAA